MILREGMYPANTGAVFSASKLRCHDRHAGLVQEAFEGRYTFGVVAGIGNGLQKIPRRGIAEGMTFKMQFHASAEGLP